MAHGRALCTLYYKRRYTEHFCEGATEGIALDVAIGVDNEKAEAWLEDALENAFTQGQLELVAYLEAVFEDVLFEMELSDRL
jgi:hypothetical protein